MFYIFFVILLFIVSVFLHILFCRRTSKPGLQAKAFIVTALIFLCVYAVVVFVLAPAGMLDEHTLWGLPFKITAAIIFLLLVPIYLSFYVLTQLTSPSKKILLAIARQGELSYSGILASVQQEDFITSRLNDLCDSGCVRISGGQYILTSNGQKIAGILNLMQFVLGRNAGG